MKREIVLTAHDLEGLLTQEDLADLDRLELQYGQALEAFGVLSSSPKDSSAEKEKENLIRLYDSMGKAMQEVTSKFSQIHVYPFETPTLLHGEASRLIAKLRDVKTGHDEFVYYIQRAYELLFNLAFGTVSSSPKHHLMVKTPVTSPVQNFAVHKIPDVDSKIENTVMCVMLRGALLPSMILSKEIQENSSTGYVTPFALFRIKRNDDRSRADMEYVLDLSKSFFSWDDLHDKDLVFADPMNATGGSLVTIVKYLQKQKVKPRSIRFFNVISALRGTLNVVRALDNVSVYTLWIDPALNEKAYIMPGLGDAGDRLNGVDSEISPRNMIQLLADYGPNILSLYRSQVKTIEKTILG